MLLKMMSPQRTDFHHNQMRYMIHSTKKNRFIWFKIPYLGFPTEFPLLFLKKILFLWRYLHIYKQIYFSTFTRWQHAIRTVLNFLFQQCSEEPVLPYFFKGLSSILLLQLMLHKFHFQKWNFQIKMFLYNLINIAKSSSLEFKPIYPVISCV